MKKVSNVFWITLGLVVLAVLFGAFAPESFESRNRQYEEFHHIIIRLVLFTCRHRNCTVLPVLHRQSNGTDYTRKA